MDHHLRELQSRVKDKYSIQFMLDRYFFVNNSTDTIYKNSQLKTENMWYFACLNIILILTLYHYQCWRRKEWNLKFWMGRRESSCSKLIRPLKAIPGLDLINGLREMSISIICLTSSNKSLRIRYLRKLNTNLNLLKRNSLLLSLGGSNRVLNLHSW